MGQSPTEEELIKMINEVDSTGQGAISYYINIPKKQTII